MSSLNQYQWETYRREKDRVRREKIESALADFAATVAWFAFAFAIVVILA